MTAFAEKPGEPGCLPGLFIESSPFTGSNTPHDGYIKLSKHRLLALRQVSTCRFERHSTYAGKLTRAARLKRLNNSV